MQKRKKRYYNITVDAIMKYLSLYQHYQKKLNLPKKSFLLLKQVVYSRFTLKTLLDLIDMQSEAYHDFRFIMVYQDHFTKFVILKALKNKHAEGVAFNLLDIYTTFGDSVILHSDNRKEFVNGVLNELHAMWKNVKICMENFEYPRPKV